MFRRCTARVPTIIGVVISILHLKGLQYPTLYSNPIALRLVGEGKIQVCFVQHDGGWS